MRYPGPDGKRREGGRYPTKAAADDARVRIRASVLGGTWRATSPADSPRLAEFAAAWLERAELAEELSPRTAALYRRLLDRLVLPDVGGIELGRMPVGRLTRGTVMTLPASAIHEGAG